MWRKLASVLMVLLVALANSTTLLSETSSQEYTVFLTYSGTLVLDVQGEDKVNTVLGGVRDHCGVRVDSIVINARYKLNMTLEFSPRNGSLLVLDVNLTVESLWGYPACAVEYAKSVLSNLVVRTHTDVPLFPDMTSSGVTVLQPPSRKGEVIGITRLDVDVVHLSNLSSTENEERKIYTRYDLYYEPLTSIPVYYVVTHTEFTPTSRVMLIFYTVLENEADIFKSIKRSVLEVQFRGPKANGTVTVILLYLLPSNLENSEAEKTPLIVTSTNSFLVYFEEPTLCFVQLGVVQTVVSSNIPLKAYIVPEGLVYYTPRALECNEVKISIPVEKVVNAVEQREFPEKGLPPQLPPATLEDFVISALVILPIIALIYWISRTISRRLLVPTSP